MKRRCRLIQWLKKILLGFLLLLVSLYILLATGFLGDVPGKIAGLLASDKRTSLVFRGLHTDIFWNTSADSVIVYDSNGLVVAVSGVQIHGSLFDYLLSGHVNRVIVDRLVIELSSDDSASQHQSESLDSILCSIDAGIAVSTDRLLLWNGMITDPSGIIIDSMYFDASIDKTVGVAVYVDSAGVNLPGFGRIGGNGLLRMFDGDVMTDGFIGFAAPGSLLVSGILSGSEETLDLEISGSGGTSSLGIPVDLAVCFAGSLTGKLSDLKVDLALSEGRGILLGKEASLEVDTLTADLQSITVRNLRLAAGDVELYLDGGFDIGSMAWNTAVRMNLSNTDISDYFEGIPASDVSGSVSVRCNGTGSSCFAGNATVDLAESSLEIADFSTLHVDATLSDNSINMKGAVTIGNGSVSFSGGGYAGSGWLPESWTMRAEGEIPDFSFLKGFDVPGNTDIGSAYFSLDGNGTRFGMNIRGSAGVRQFGVDGISAEQASLSGSLNFSTRNVVEGIPFGISFNGSAEVLDLTAEDVAVDTASLEGTFRVSGRDIALDASLLIDSLRVISDVFHTAADIEFDGDEIKIEGLSLTGSNERIYTAEVAIDMGDTTCFNIDKIRATHSKLRVVTAGGLSGFSENGSLVLDTLWLDPPVGNLGMSGIISSGKTELQLDIVNMDLSSFSTFSGLPADMSGVGNFSIAYMEDSTGMRGHLTGRISDPAYGQFKMDSVTVDVSAVDDSINVNGIYAWQNGVRSGLQLKAADVWAGTDLALLADKVQWLELEVNNLSDWLFYALPLPLRTMGASVSARVEYMKNNGDYSFEMQASARISRLYITMFGIELPDVNFYLNYPDTTEGGYNARFTIGSGNESTGNFSSSWQADILNLFPFKLGDYRIDLSLSEMEIAIPGMGAAICSGLLVTSGNGLLNRPVLSGKLKIIEGAVGIPQPVASSTGDSEELPFDLSIDVAGSGDMWFRTNFADIEMAMKLRIFTLERKPTVNGYVSAVRGRITLLSRDFQIVGGRVNIVQGNPPTMELNVTAETRVRSIISHEEYLITILITGDAENPQVNLSGSGPMGQIPQEDILTLMAAGLTYSEMQQMNSSAIRSEVENVAQTMLGSLLARNLRHEIGLDTFEISPELLSDSTSLILNVGKYVLPDLYVSYKGDVFSTDPGTVSAQYLFDTDLYVEGTSRTTIHGYQEPTLELHYTIRY